MYHRKPADKTKILNLSFLKGFQQDTQWNAASQSEPTEQLTVTRNFRFEDIYSTQSLQIEQVIMNFGLCKCHSDEHLCASKHTITYKLKEWLVWSTSSGKTSRSDSFQIYYYSQYYVWKSPTFICECQNHKEGGGEASAKANYTKKIIQSNPIILIYQPPMEKILGFPRNFSLKSLRSKWQ